MTTFPTPRPIEAALVAACEPIFAMIEKEARYAAEGERLIVALLDELQALDLSALLLIRRMRGRLAQCKRQATQQATTTAPKLRHG